MGRFMSPDPLGNFVADATNPQTWNLYAYVNNNPLTFTDPTGMDSIAPSTCTGEGVDPATCSPICQGTFCGGGVPNQNPPPEDPCVMYPGICNNPIWSTTTGTLPPEATPPEPWCAMGSACYSDLLGFFGYNNPTQIVGTPSGGGVCPLNSAGISSCVAAPQTPKQPRLVCAANKANNYSLAQAAGTNGKSGFFRTHAVEGTVEAATAPAPITELALTEQVGGEIAGKGLGGIVTVAKLGYDLTSFLVAAYKCP